LEAKIKTLLVDKDKMPKDMSLGFAALRRLKEFAATMGGEVVCCKSFFHPSPFIDPGNPDSKYISIRAEIRFKKDAL
jgi:hypothetical protein